MRFGKLATVTLVGITAVVFNVLAAAPAQSETRGSTPAAHVQQISDRVEPLSITSCINVLIGFGYTPSWPRAVACTIGSIPRPTAVPSCIVAMLATFVSPTVAVLACGSAILP